MARSKRKSSVLEAAQHRLAGLKSISPAPAFGTGLTVDDYETEIQTFITALNSYNQKLAELDDAQNTLEELEAALREKNRRMLAGAEAQYGPDSSQFEQAGGTRQSERKKPKRKPPTDEDPSKT
jgi:predicted  nucleic acid-binding Zn-ribbon protein